MYAIIKTGGKQYRVQENDVLKVEKLSAAVGETVIFDEVVAVGGDKLQVGTPLVEGCAVQAEVLEQVRTKRLLSSSTRRRRTTEERMAIDSHTLLLRLQVLAQQLRRQLQLRLQKRQISLR